MNSFKRWIQALTLVLIVVVFVTVMVGVIENIDSLRWAFVSIQRSLLEQLSDYLDLVDSGDWKALIITVLCTFAYGFTHSLGPGHGKSAVMLLATSSTLSRWKLVWLSLLINMLQAAVTISIVLLANQFLSIGYRASIGWVASINQFVGAGMVVLGVVYLIKGCIKQKRPHEPEVSTVATWNFSNVALYGLRPCSSTALIGLFSMLWFGWQLSLGLMLASFFGSFLSLSLVVVFGQSAWFKLESLLHRRHKNQEKQWMWGYVAVFAIASFYIMVGWLFWETSAVQMSPIL